MKLTTILLALLAGCAAPVTYNYSGASRQDLLTCQMEAKKIQMAGGDTMNSNAEAVNMFHLCMASKGY